MIFSITQNWCLNNVPDVRRQLQNREEHGVPVHPYDLRQLTEVFVMLYVNGYRQELENYVRENESLLKSFDGQSFLISGAAGLIGSYLIDILLTAKRVINLDVHILACDRNRSLLAERFERENTDVVRMCDVDVCKGDLPDVAVDYIVHAASNTSPVDYATKPIDTIRTNIIGTDELCDYAVRNRAKRFLFCSSVEAYGRNNGDVDRFAEDYSGYVDSNTVRANYPAAKRCSEALCNAYAAENPSFDFVIARIGRFYGPTVIAGDSKAPTQFIRNAVAGESIVLKSDGSQLYSWGYVGDCAIALLTILSRGERGGAYNVADPASCKTLREFAAIAASAGNGKVEFIAQSAVEQAGYSKITKATLDTTRIESLGWKAMHHLETGIPRTVNYLKQLWR